MRGKLTTVKMSEALNNTEHTQLETSRHVEETKTNFYWPCSDTDHGFLEDFKKRDDQDSKCKYVVIYLNYSRQDAGQEHTITQQTLEQLKNKLDHVVMLQEKQECWYRIKHTKKYIHTHELYTK